jgi:hypothetical protein
MGTRVAWLVMFLLGNVFYIKLSELGGVLWKDGGASEFFCNYLLLDFP